MEKDDLSAFGKHLQLHVRAAMKEEEIRSPVSQHLVKEGVLKEPVSQNPTSSSDGPDLFEKYKYELELNMKYFLHFEKIAGNLICPKEHWALLIQRVLKRKAQEIYTQLSLEQASNYDTVKEVILKGY